MRPNSVSIRRPDPLADLAVVHQLRVAAADGEVGLGAGHLRVGEQGGEERPLALHLLQQLEPVLLDGRIQGGAEPEPGGQDDPRLRPREDPGDRAEVGDVARRLALRRPRAELQPRDLVDRGGGVEERRRGPDRRRRGRGRPRRSGAPSPSSPRRSARVARAPARRPAPGVLTSTALPVSSSSRWAISGSENLAESTSPCSVIFMRPATVPGGCAWIARLAGPPPRPERAAAAVEEDPRDVVAPELLGERDLGAVGRPARRDVARVLVGVRVADHHLLLVADRAQRGAVDRQARAARAASRATARATPPTRTAGRSAAARARRPPRRARSPSSAAAPRAGGRAPRCRR